MPTPAAESRVEPDQRHDTPGAGVEKGSPDETVPVSAQLPGLDKRGLIALSEVGRSWEGSIPAREAWERASRSMWWIHVHPQQRPQPARRARHLLPAEGSLRRAKVGTEITPAMIPSVSKYAGRQLLTGPQAEAYADHFTAIHLSEMPYGGIYSKISTAQPIHQRSQ